MDLVLSRSYMSYYILFWGPSTVSRAFLAFIKNRGFGLCRSYMSYCILFCGPSTVLRAFLAIMKTRGFGPFSQSYELLHTVLGSVDSFEGISVGTSGYHVWKSAKLWFGLIMTSHRCTKFST